MKQQFLGHYVSYRDEAENPLDVRAFWRALRVQEKHLWIFVEVDPFFNGSGGGGFGDFGKVFENANKMMN